MGATRPTLDRVRMKRGEIHRIAAVHGMRNVRVFGSVARGTATEKSDVDLLIDFQHQAPDDFEYYGLLCEVQEAVERVLGRRVHVIHMESAASPRAQRILHEAIPL